MSTILLFYNRETVNVCVCVLYREWISANGWVRLSGWVCVGACMQSYLCVFLVCRCVCEYILVNLNVYVRIRECCWGCLSGYRDFIRKLTTFWWHLVWLIMSSVGHQLNLSTTTLTEIASIIAFRSLTKIRVPSKTRIRKEDPERKKFAHLIFFLISRNDLLVKSGFQATKKLV